MYSSTNETEQTNMTNLAATINFPNHAMASTFVLAWSRATLAGHTVGAIKNDGSVGVTVYNVDDIKKEFIETYIGQINKQEV